eukprot:gene22891-biopygen20781
MQWIPCCEQCALLPPTGHSGAGVYHDCAATAELHHCTCTSTRGGGPVGAALPPEEVNPGPVGASADVFIAALLDRPMWVRSGRLPASCELPRPADSPAAKECEPLFAHVHLVWCGGGCSVGHPPAPPNSAAGAAAGAAASSASGEGGGQTAEMEGTRACPWLVRTCAAEPDLPICRVHTEGAGGGLAPQRTPPRPAGAFPPVLLSGRCLGGSRGGSRGCGSPAPATSHPRRGGCWGCVCRWWAVVPLGRPRAPGRGGFGAS